MTDPKLPSPADLRACLLKDRAPLRRLLGALDDRRREGKPFDALLARYRQELAASQALFASRLNTQPRLEFPAELPVSERWQDIAEAIRVHQVVVLCGATGSGKSTQLPKICLALGRGVSGRIGHTQPRRLAARSLSHRLAQETGQDLGGLVGYKVRFHDRVRPETRVKLMTDGILLAEIQRDRMLLEYDTLILDEAHERSLNIDFLLGYLKQLLPRRRDLKLIITSATIDPQRFSRHFGDAPVLEVSGRTYPVEVRYRPPAEEAVGERDVAMQASILAAVDELSKDGRGDILVFLSGEREIRETAEALRKHKLSGTEVLPLYARLGPADQAKVFQSHGARRILLATNVAETSLTVPGIHYVIDPGFARVSRYSHRSKVQRLPVEAVSQASAEQRKGRCGRVAAGICIRLYSEENFAARREFTEPEILRTNLAAVILHMRVLGFGDIEDFPFLETPDPRLVADGYRLLTELGAVDRDRAVTPLGRQLARLPVDPRIGRMLLAAADGPCLPEVLVIAAALGVQDPRERPLDQRQAADEIHATFHHPDSDFLGLLNLWRFLQERRAHLSRNQFQKMCRQHFLSWNRVVEWEDTHQQLQALLHEQFPQRAKDPPLAAEVSELAYETIHRALLTGLLSHVGLRDERDYQGVRSARFWIHPSSGLFEGGPKWVMAAERVQTSKDYGRTLARIQPQWIESAAAHLLSRAYSDPHWQADTAQVAAFEKVTLFGLVLVPRRRVNYGPINPVEARALFIRGALVDRDYSSRAPFFRHNRELIEYVEHLEAKSRRQDLLVDPEAIYDFYDQRIPPGIYCGPDFEQWLRRESGKNPKLLHLRIGDVLRQGAEDPSGGRFPDFLTVGGTELPLEYHFDPGHRADGVTLVVPLALVNQVPAARCEWLVPGLLEELVTALLRGLPKTLRKALVPIPDTVARVLPRLVPCDRPLVQVLGQALRDLTGQAVPEDVWDLDAVPEHLRMRFRVLDDAGQELGAGRDFPQLRREHGRQGQAQFAQRPALDLERDGLRRWDFGPLPEILTLERGGIRVQGYPALVDRGDSVAVRVLDAPESAQLAHRAGLRRLLMLTLPAETRQLRKGLSSLGPLRLAYALAAPAPVTPDGPPPDLADELVALILDRAFIGDQPGARDPATFEARITAGKPQLWALTQALQKLIAEILAAHQRIRTRLDSLTQAHWAPSVADMGEQLQGLIFRGFPLQVPFEILGRYPRYLRALETRLERLPSGGGRDRERLQEMAGLLADWRDRDAKARSAGRRDPRLEEIRWQLEELRISLFAQPQPTSQPVSVRRIAKRWLELGL